MKSLNNELFVHRNENFTIDKTLQNKDGSPYIISSDLPNPYFLITVANTRYVVDDRYIYSKWLKLDKLSRFKNTTPVNLKIFKTEPNGTVSKYTSFDSISSTIKNNILKAGTVIAVGSIVNGGLSLEWTLDEDLVVYKPYAYQNDVDGRGTKLLAGTVIKSGSVVNCHLYESDTTLTEPLIVDTDSEDIVASGYVGEDFYASFIGDDVFYIENNGTRTYKYWKNSGWTEYKCRIIVSYSQEITKEWIDQNYVYSITLVSGSDTNTYLHVLCTEYNIPTSATTTNEEMYDLLIAAGHTFPEDFNYGRPIYTFDTFSPILVPTKLTVASNTEGQL